MVMKQRLDRRWLVLLILGAAICIGMCLFMDDVSAAISYTPSTGSLASTTSLNNGFVEQLYTADKAGTLILRNQLTKTSNDSAPVAHTYKFEPADYLMLGGSNNDFNVTVIGWDATLLNLTVRLYGTNWYGVNQSEDLYFTGNGVRNATLLYRTSNSSMIFKCYKTGAFSVSVVVAQGQWGRVWKNSVNSYRFVNCTPALSGFYNQTNTSLSFYPASTTLINFGTAGKAIFGNLSSTGVARWGCHFINEKNVNGSLGATAAVTYMKFYACSFMSYRFNRSSSSLRVSETLGMLDIRNCVFSQNSYIISGGTNSIFSRNTIVSAVAGVGAVLGTTGSCSDMFFDNVSIPISFTNSAFTGSNFTLGGYDYLFKWIPTGITPYVHHFRNFKVLGDLKALYYGTATGTQKVLLEYGISLRVRNGTANLSGATVQYFEINASTLVRKRVQSLTSGADGLVTYKYLNRSIWLKSNVYPRSNYTVSVWINKSGYQSVRMNFTMSRELVFDVVLLQNYTSGLVVAENIVDAVGTHEYAWRPSLGVHGEWWVWANYTGTGGGGSVSSENLSVINPNPGNGTHDTNFLKKDAGGLSTSLDITINNFTTGGGLYEYMNKKTNSSYPITNENNYYGQVFKVGTTGVNASFTLRFAKLFFSNMIKGRNLTFYITGTTLSFGDYLPNLADVKTSVDNVSSSDFYNGWNTINFPDIVLIKGTSYAILVRDFNVSMANEIGLCLVESNEYLGGKFSWYMPGIGWNIYLQKDALFEIYGNISYSYCLNVSFLDNSSGHWVVYNSNTYTWNQTVTVPFLNASGVGRYWWKAETESNHTLYLNTSVFWFQTVASGGGGVSSHKRELDYLILGTMGCIPMLLILRRKKKNIL